MLEPTRCNNCYFTSFGWIIIICCIKYTIFIKVTFIFPVNYFFFMNCSQMLQCNYWQTRNAFANFIKPPNSWKTWFFHQTLKQHGWNIGFKNTSFRISIFEGSDFQSCFDEWASILLFGRYIEPQIYQQKCKYYTLQPYLSMFTVKISWFHFILLDEW